MSLIILNVIWTNWQICPALYVWCILFSNQIILINSGLLVQNFDHYYILTATENVNPCTNIDEIKIKFNLDRQWYTVVPIILRLVSPHIDTNWYKPQTISDDIFICGAANHIPEGVFNTLYPGQSYYEFMNNIMANDVNISRGRITNKNEKLRCWYY